MKNFWLFWVLEIIWNWLRNFIGNAIYYDNSILGLQARAKGVGAAAGGASTFVSLQVGGYWLEGIIDSQSVGYGASGVSFITIFLGCCLGYPLIGVAVGSFIGRLSVKPDDDPEDTTAVSIRAVIGGGIAGLVIGSLPVLFLGQGTLY